MDWITDRQRELVAEVARLGPAMAQRSERYDREASFPYENFADLRDAGFLALCIPESYGGLGGSFATYGLVAEELGRHCGSTALAFNMHTATCLLAGQVADELELSPADAKLLEGRRERLFGDIVANHTVHSQPFSEGLSPDATRGFATTATAVDGGYRVNGRKIFASLSTSADIHNVACMVDGDDRVRLLGVPADAEGVKVVGDWDPLGMRATVSRTLLFEDVFVPEDAALMPHGVYYQAANRWPHMFMTLTPSYMGIAQACYDFTVAYLRGEVPGTPPVKRRMYPTKQLAVAEMRVTLEQTKALWFQAISEARPDPSKDSLMRAWAAQHTVMENANDLARLAIRTCGGQSMLKSLPLERLYRDSRCGSLMLPWTADLCLDMLAKGTLYEPGETDDD